MTGKTSLSSNGVSSLNSQWFHLIKLKQFSTSQTSQAIQVMSDLPIYPTKCTENSLKKASSSL